MPFTVYSTVSDRFEVITPAALRGGRWIPEIHGGFTAAPERGDWAEPRFEDTPSGLTAQGACLPDGRFWPIWVRAPLGRAGNFRVTVRLITAYGASVQLFCQRRQLMYWQNNMSAGEHEMSFLVHAGAIIPREHSEAMNGFDLDICLMSSDAALVSLSVAPSDAPTLFLMGDSTVTDQIAELPYAPMTSYAGWGQMLPRHIASCAVSNHARSGLTTESFRAEGHWSVMKNELRSGDTVLMQFGHNDQKLKHLEADNGYANNLQVYIDDIRKQGAAPVLVTPLARNTWRADGQYNDLLARYASAVRALGEKTGVPVLDLNRLSTAFIRATGLEPARRYFYPRDYTHTNDFGACRMARYIADEMRMRMPGLPEGFFRDAPPEPEPPETMPGEPLSRLAESTKSATPGRAPQAVVERPDDPLTRTEAIAMVVSACHFFATNACGHPYPDVPAVSEHTGAVAAAAQNGLIPPEWTPDGLLRPNEPAAPADFAALLMRGVQSRMTLWPRKPLSCALPAYARESAELLAAKGLFDEALACAQALKRQRAALICAGLPL